MSEKKSCKYFAWNQPNAKNDMFNQILADHQMVKAKLSILAMKSDKLVRIESELRQLTIVFCVVVIDALFKWRHERKCAGIVSFFHILCRLKSKIRKFSCFKALFG